MDTNRQNRDRPSRRGQYADDVLTTGQAAKLLRVAPRTATKIFDAGLVDGYRLPGSKDRRIYRDSLERFMAARGMRNGHTPRVLLVGLVPAAATELAALLQPDFASTAADTAIRGAAMLADRPAVVVVEVGSVGRGAALELAALAREMNATAKCVCLLTEDDGRPMAWEEQGYSAIAWGETAADIAVVVRGEVG